MSGAGRLSGDVEGVGERRFVSIVIAISVVERLSRDVEGVAELQVVPMII